MLTLHPETYNFLKVRISAVKQRAMTVSCKTLTIIMKLWEITKYMGNSIGVSKEAKNSQLSIT